MTTQLKTEQKSFLQDKGALLAGLTTALFAARFGIFATAAGLFIAGVSVVLLGKRAASNNVEPTLDQAEVTKPKVKTTAKPKAKKVQTVQVEPTPVAEQTVTRDPKREMLFALSKDSAALAQNSFAWIKEDKELTSFATTNDTSILEGNKLRRRG